MKTKQWMMAGALLALAVTFTSCVNSLKSLSRLSDSERVSETRSLKGFEQIEVNGSPTVYYTQADTFSVVVKGTNSYVDDIITEVNDGVLNIRNRGKIGIVNVSFDHDEGAVYVTSPDLTAIRLNGSGDFVSSQRVDTDNMQIVMRGSGDIDVKDLICDHCTSELIGSGDLNINRLESQTSAITLVGSGDIDIRQWQVLDTDVALRGSGDISVHFAQGCRSVKCQLAGSGDIKLSGQIDHYSGEKGGSGDIDIDKLSIQK